MAWLSGWAKRVKCTIDSGDIDAELTWHPLHINISTSSGINSEDVSFVFDELTEYADRRKIAVTKADGTTELYVEIEKWDEASKKASLWASLTGWTWSPDADTDVYLYYDSTHLDNDAYVGAIWDEVIENVWDGNFKAVHHMANARQEQGVNTSLIFDSTSNDNDGAKKDAAEPIETEDGKIGRAQDFDGQDDEIQLAAGALDSLVTGTIEGWYKFHTISATTDGGGLWVAIKTSTDRIHLKAVSDDELRLYNDIGDIGNGVSTADSPLDTVNWFYIVTTVDSGGVWKVYVNLTEKLSHDWNNDFSDIASGWILHIGSKLYASALYHDGEQDEVRVSDKVRDTAWRKASYESGRDHLLDWGSEETAEIGEHVVGAEIDTGISVTATRGVNYTRTALFTR